MTEQQTPVEYTASYDSVCRCGHPRTFHMTLGYCAQPLPSGWHDVTVHYCAPHEYDDARLPAPGERLTFGVHRQPTTAAETAEAWPPMGTWSARVKAKTTRALRSLR